MENETFSITTTQKTAPKVNGAVFEQMKNIALGKKYNLSLVFIGDKKSKELNKTYRQKDYPTDILSFSIDSKSGEIFINPKVAKKKAKLFNRTESNYLDFLFIHGLFHLKGMDHGRIMEKEEEKLRKKFNI